jgi:DNA-binding beta-propeller fold protein YncE
VYNASNQETLAIAFDGNPSAVVFTPDGSHAFVSTGTIAGTGAIYTLDPASHAVTGKLTASAGAVVLRVSADGQYLYAAQSNGTFPYFSISTYDIANGTRVSHMTIPTLGAYQYAISDLAVSQDGSVLALGLVQSLCDEVCEPPGPAAIIVQINGTLHLETRRIYPPVVSTLAISPDDSTIYAAAGSSINLYSTANGKLLSADNVPATSLALIGTTLYAGAGGQSGTGVLTALQTPGGQVLQTTTVPFGVCAIGGDASGASLYIGSCALGGPSPYKAASVSPGSLTPGTPFRLNGSVGGLAVSGPGGELWVAISSPDQVQSFDTGANTEAGGAEADAAPFSSVVLPNGSKVYTASYPSSDVSVFNGTTFVRSSVIPTGADSLVGFGAASPDGTAVYMVAGGLQQIDTSTDSIARTIATAGAVQSAAVSDDSQTVYTLEYAGQSVFLKAYAAATGVATGSLVLSSNGDFFPERMLISPTNNQMFVVSPTTLTFIGASPLQVVKTVQQGCYDGAVSPDGNTFYCLAFPSTTGSIVDVLAYSTSSQVLLRTFATGYFAPEGYIAFSPTGSTLYVSLAVPSTGNILLSMNASTGSAKKEPTSAFGPLAIQTQQ